MAEQPCVPGNCSKQCLNFSSLVYNYIVICITKQRKLKKIPTQDFKLELKFEKTAHMQKRHHFLYFESILKILLKRLEPHTKLESCSPLRWFRNEPSWDLLRFVVSILRPFNQYEPDNMKIPEITSSSIEAKQLNISETCSKQCLFFSSPKHNYILISITKQRKLNKIKE